MILTRKLVQDNDADDRRKERPPQALSVPWTPPQPKPPKPTRRRRKAITGN